MQKKSQSLFEWIGNRKILENWEFVFSSKHAVYSSTGVVKFHALYVEAKVNLKYWHGHFISQFLSNKSCYIRGSGSQRSIPKLQCCFFMEIVKVRLFLDRSCAIFSWLKCIVIFNISSADFQLMSAEWPWNWVHWRSRNCDVKTNGV